MLFLNAQYQQPHYKTLYGPSACCCEATCEVLEEQSHCSEVALIMEQQYINFWVFSLSSIW